MQLKVSKESFGQSAKILHKHIQEQFGAQGRGGLSKARELLAKTLKFDSMHDLDLFFNKDEPLAPSSSAPVSVAVAVTKKGDATPPESSNTLVAMASLSLEERMHLLNNLSVLLGQDGGWRTAAQPLLNILVRLDDVKFVAHGIYLGDGHDSPFFMKRVLSRSSLDNLVGIHTRIRNAQRVVGSEIGSNPVVCDIGADIESYLNRLPGYRKGATNQSGTATDQHGDLIATIVPLLNIVQQIESGADRLLVPASLMECCLNLRVPNDTFFSNHWFSEVRFYRAVKRQALKHQREGIVPRDFKVWDCLKASLSMPMEGHRQEALACLMDIVKIPDSFFKDISQDLEINIQEYLVYMGETK